MNIEDLYGMTRSLRFHGKHADAWACFQLAHEQPYEEKWSSLFAYEKSVLSFYVGIPREEGLVDYMRSYSLYDNIDYFHLQYYVIPFSSSIQPFPVEAKEDFLPTSTSILRLSPDLLLLNVRCVNYRIQADGSYLMSENNLLSRHADIRTRNILILTNNAFEPVKEEEMRVPQEPIHARNIHGLEDIRLFRKGHTIYFSASTCEYSHNGCIQEIQGVYNIDTYELTDLEQMHSPTESLVEKNWIPFNQAYGTPSVFIYSWNPLKIGSVRGGKFHIEKEIVTPRFFKHVRGSTTFVSHSDDLGTYLYAMVHCVIETCPRKYYHMLVKLDPQTYDLVSYTVPYYFVKNHIEYTLGIDIVGSVLSCIVSQNDCDPIVVQIEMSSLLWV